MGLETGTYISDLVATNPTFSDPVSAGDDHVRLIKATIKNTFPNVSGAVTATHTELNYVDGVTSNIQTQIDNIDASASVTYENLNANGDVGTTASTVCAGNDSRLSDARQCNNTFANAATSRTNLGLGSLATLNSVAEGNLNAGIVSRAKLQTTTQNLSVTTNVNTAYFTLQPYAFFPMLRNTANTSGTDLISGSLLCHSTAGNADQPRLGVNQYYRPTFKESYTRSDSYCYYRYVLA